jgi:exodeoxyribonuclease VII large subunit
MFMEIPSPDDRDGALLATTRPGDNAEPLTVSELSAQLKRTVEDRFGFVRLRGELSGVKRAASGHFYCSLKDEGARIDGVMWRGSAARLAFVPEDGVEVIATGKLTTYPGRSTYQIVIERMEIAGEGALLALLAKLKARLEAEGLFDTSRKRALPFLPRVIGVVTSPTGAVIRDILHRLSDRFPTRVLVWPVLVQGQDAAAQVAAAVRGFSDFPEGGAIPRPDLVIVARGGGSVEDLWAFNEEAVVRAIAASTIPVISAVGHETDTTLADFAADLRAPTPTAAAELAVPVHAELTNLIVELVLRQHRGQQRIHSLARERLAARAERLPQPLALFAQRAQRLDDLSERLRRGLVHRTEVARGRLARDAGALRPALVANRLAAARETLARSRFAPALLGARFQRASDALTPFARLLPQLDPDLPLGRGFARVLGAQGQTLKTAAAAARKPALTLKFADADLAVVPGPARPRLARSVAPQPGQGHLF